MLFRSDADGNIYEVASAIRIYDDAPANVTFGGSADTHDAGAEYQGSWTAVFGADNADADNPLQITVSLGSEQITYTVVFGQAQDIELDNVNYGSLTVNADGSFSFVSKPNTEGELNFKLIATDSDGDSAVSNDGAGFTITVDIPDGPDPNWILGSETDEWFSDRKSTRLNSSH